MLSTPSLCVSYHRLAMPLQRFTSFCFAFASRHFAVPCQCSTLICPVMPLLHDSWLYQHYALLHCAIALLRQSLLLSAVTMTCPSSLCHCRALPYFANATHTWNCFTFASLSDPVLRRSTSVRSFTFAAHCRDSPCQGCDLTHYAVAMLCFSSPMPCETTTAPLNPCITIRGRTPLRFANA